MQDRKMDYIRNSDRESIVGETVKGFVKSKKVQVVLGAKVVETEALKCFLYNWLGSDERFYSLVAPYTEATVYNFPDVMYTANSSFDDVLNHNLKVFDTKEEWQSGKWSEYEIRNEMKNLKIFLDGLATGYLKLPHHTVQSIMTHLHPVLGMTILYKDSKDKQNSLTIWFNSVTAIEVDDAYIGELLTAMKIENRVRVVQCAKSLRLEEAIGFDY